MSGKPALPLPYSFDRRRKPERSSEERSQAEEKNPLIQSALEATETRKKNEKAGKLTAVSSFLCFHLQKSTHFSSSAFQEIRMQQVL